MLLALVALAAQTLPPPRAPDPVEAAATRHRVIRLPIRRARAATVPLPTFKEKHGPRCIFSDDIAAAAVTSPDGVDIILKGGQRLRARLESECPALDYYGGFYVSPSADGRICADRDEIRTRSGGACGIDRFRTLVPNPPPVPPEPPRR